MDKRVIFMADRVSITIAHADWPVQVVAVDYSTHGEYALRVRENRDGRVLIYGTHGSHITGETYAAAGVLIDAAGDAVAALRCIGSAVKAPGSLVSAAIRDLAELA